MGAHHRRLAARARWRLRRDTGDGRDDRRDPAAGPQHRGPEGAMTTEAQERLAARLDALLLRARQAWGDGQRDEAFGVLGGAVSDAIQDLRGSVADEEKRAAAPYPVAVKTVVRCPH